MRACRSFSARIRRGLSGTCVCRVRNSKPAVLRSLHALRSHRPAAVPACAGNGLHHRRRPAFQHDAGLGRSACGMEDTLGVPSVARRQPAAAIVPVPCPVARAAASAAKRPPHPRRSCRSATCPPPAPAWTPRRRFPWPGSARPAQVQRLQIGHGRDHEHAGGCGDQSVAAPTARPSAPSRRVGMEGGEPNRPQAAYRTSATPMHTPAQTPDGAPSHQAPASVRKRPPACRRCGARSGRRSRRAEPATGW